MKLSDFNAKEMVARVRERIQTWYGWANIKPWMRIRIPIKEMPGWEIINQHEQWRISSPTRVLPITPKQEEYIPEYVTDHESIESAKEWWEPDKNIWKYDDLVALACYYFAKNFEYYEQYAFDMATKLETENDEEIQGINWVLNDELKSKIPFSDMNEVLESFEPGTV